MAIRSFDPNKKIPSTKIDTPVTPVETQRTDEVQSTPAELPENLPAGAAQAKRALGFVDGGQTSQAKTVGAKAAVDGLGFVDGVKRTWKKGLLTAMAGVMFVGSLAPNLVADKRTPEPTGPPTFSMSVEGRKAFELQRQGERDINDARLVVSKWESQNRRDPNFKVSNDDAVELIRAALLPARPGDDVNLMDFAKANLGQDTKQLMNTLLEGRVIKLSPEARQTMELAVGRIHAIAHDGKIKVLGNQEGGKISITGVPGATLEAINLSTIPTKRFHQDDTFKLGTLDAQGKFAGNMELREGDIIRLRLRLPDGSTTQFVDFKAHTNGQDTRNAEVALFRVGLFDDGAGNVTVNNINSSRPISEPGATLRFVNLRTNESTDIVLNSEGTFVDGLKIPGKPGDQYSVRVTDGINDKDLAQEIGKVSVSERGRSGVVEGIDLKDPTLHRDEIGADGKPMYTLMRYRGPLFEAEAKAADVVQGNIGDCYFPAAVAAIAHHNPGHFEKMMKQVEQTDADGKLQVWYEVTFKEKDWSTGKYKDVVIKVDGDLYVRSWGGPLYGSDDGAKGAEDMEMWFPILEKAYAEWKGESYNSIGDGGHVSTVFRDLLGADVDDIWISGADKETVWKQIVKNVDSKLAIGAGTYGKNRSDLYTNAGVYANHAYSILDYKEEGGEKYVQLRNPWGESEPYPGDGSNDGVFWLKLDDFTRLYQTLYFVDQ